VNPIAALFGDDGVVVRKTEFQLLFLVNVVGALSISIISPILDSLTGPLGASPAEIGLMISLYTAPTIAITPIAGIVADRVGRKPILVSGLLLFGLAGTAIAAATDFRTALVFRFLQGVGFACITPIIITSIGDLYDGSLEATAQGIRFTGSGIVHTVFPVVSATMVALAWQYPFLLFASAFPAAAVLYVVFEEPVNRSETDGGSRSDGDSDATVAAALRLFTQRRVAAFVTARSVPMVFWFGFLAYNSIIVVRLLGGTPMQAGLLAATGSLAFAVAATQAGRVTAFFTHRRTPLFGANLLMGVGYAAVLLADQIAIAFAGIAVAGSGFGVSMALYRSIITGLAPERVRGSIVSISEAFAMIIGTATPIVMGWCLAVGTPAIGFASTLRIVGLIGGAIVVVGGTICLLTARSAPPVTLD